MIYHIHMSKHNIQHFSDIDFMLQREHISNTELLLKMRKRRVNKENQIKQYN